MSNPWDQYHSQAVQQVVRLLSGVTDAVHFSNTELGRLAVDLEARKLHLNDLPLVQKNSVQRRSILYALCDSLVNSVLSLRVAGATKEALDVITKILDTSIDPEIRSLSGKSG